MGDRVRIFDNSQAQRRRSRFFATLLAYTEKCLKYSYEKWADFIGTLALALAATAAGLAIFV